MSESKEKKGVVRTVYKFEVQDGSKKRCFGILKPSRRMKQEGELFYSAQLSKFISAGVLPRALWEKMIKNNGGAVADPDKEKYSDLYDRLMDLNTRLIDLQPKEGEEASEEIKEKQKDIQSDIIIVRRAMQDLENEQTAIYENTAEAKARNQSVLWWFFKSAVEIFDDGKRSESFIPQDLSYDKQMDYLDSLLEDDEESFEKDIASRLNYLATVWFLGAASSQSDFEYFDKEYLGRKDGSSEKEDDEPEIAEDSVSGVEEVAKETAET